MDGSASGLLLRSPIQYAANEKIKLTFKVVPTQDEWIRTEAIVIRSARAEDSDDPWPVWVALRLAEPIMKLEMLFQIADDRRKNGDPRSRKRHSGVRQISRVVTEHGVQFALG